MVDAMVSNTIGSDTVWVQVPSPAPYGLQIVYYGLNRVHSLL